MTSIGSSAFYGCKGLTSISIPNSVTSIGDGAFRDCSSLTSVTIPNSLTSIGSSAFSGCSGLTSIIVEKGNTKYDSRNNCNAIIETQSSALIAGCKNTIIPNSVTSIGSSAFSGCSGLTSIDIPNSVTNIGSYAFSGCSGLAYVVIPISVTNIGDYSFNGCFASIICEANIPPYCQEIGVDQKSKIYVPANSIALYKAANGWKNYTNIETIVETENITFANTKEIIAFGKTKTLKVTFIPEDATTRIITWKSSNEAVATISSNGVVTPRSLGTSVITATTYNGKTATCTVVVEQPITSITINIKKTSLWVDNTKSITATVIPTTASNAAVNWSSSDESVAIVSSEGLVTAKGKGTCTITCTAADGYGAKTTSEVTVKQQVTAITLSNVPTSLLVGETKTITKTVTPTTASSTAVTWYSSNTNIVTVSSNGVITAKGKGTCIITCTAADGYGTKTSFVVTVKEPVNSIALSEKSASMWVGDTKTLVAKVTPTTASNTAVEWSSSDNGVATISTEGVITAKGKGSCIITCTAADGYGTKSTCSVSVKQQVTEIRLNETKASLWVGDTKTIIASALPSIANNTSVKWSSSDASVATVSSDGQITANGEGTCTITCTAADGYGTHSVCEVTVIQKETSIEELHIENDKRSVYNLKGQRINKSNIQKGIYIINGKKVVIK